MGSARFGALAGIVAAAVTTFAGGGTAHAQAASPGIALDRFEPAPAGDRMFGVPSPYAAGGLTPHVMLLLDYAHDPLSLRVLPSNANLGAVVSSQMYLNLDAGLSLWNRVHVDVDVPVAVLQSGNNPSGQGETFTSPSSAQLGDLRLDARVVLWGKYFDPLQVAIGGYLWVPTGASGSFVSPGSVRGLPQAILGGRVAERIVWSAAFGPEIQGTSSYGNVEQGAMFRWGAGVGILLLDSRHLQVGGEASGDVVFRQVSRQTTNAEFLFDARYRFLGSFEAAAGFGPGLTSGLGTPDFRALASVAYTPEPKPQVTDRDGDGIPDKEDACPDVPGVADPDPAKNGCPTPPSDRDGDGILDAVDACPDVKGVPDPDPAKNGCPPPSDRDGDGIPDAEDACPDEKGPRSPDPHRNGCPVVHLSDTEVVTFEQVQFDTGKATIKKVSDPLLDKVAAVLNSHLEITRLEVQGHTDNRGSAALNKTLSQARAAAVLKALLARNVAKERLTSKGYGQDQPIADNTTDAGRQQNRRVQFAILSKKPKAAP